MTSQIGLRNSAMEAVRKNNNARSEAGNCVSETRIF